MTNISRQQVATAVTILSCIQDMCSSELGQDASCPDLGLLWYSCPPGHVSEQYHKHSDHFLPNPLQFIIYHPIIRRYTDWDTYMIK